MVEDRKDTIGGNCEGPKITIKGDQKVQVRHLDAGVWGDWVNVPLNVPVPIDVGGVHLQCAEPGMMVKEWKGDFKLASGTRYDSILKLHHLQPIMVEPVFVPRPSSGAPTIESGPTYNLNSELAKNGRLEKLIRWIDKLE